MSNNAKRNQRDSSKPKASAKPPQRNNQARKDKPDQPTKVNAKEVVCSKRKTRQDDARQVQESKERMQSKENKDR